MSAHAQVSKRLQRIAEAKRSNVMLWKEGVSIENDTGHSISLLLCRVAADRWRLAVVFERQANKLLSAKPAQNRSAISRYYYCMYHAIRACVFIETQGDDHEAHSELPLHIPPALDRTINWQNKLKDARLLRNKADYEAYPKAETAWHEQAVNIRADAELLLKKARIFLKSKGCSI